MATLILGTVGRAIGGPIGGLFGSFLGGTIDRGLFGGGTTREGPRPANLAVQSAAYGEPLSRIYGRMRAAGTLVWTAGIKESQHRTGGGKSGTATNSYSYSSSFAVIVAGRAIDRIERIWADGKVLRAQDGTLNFPATIRTYRGDEAQTVDPLIAAAEGGLAPAYRGRAYVVFEDLPLADYGNRIPNLTFEVVADGALVGVDAIAVDIGAGLIEAHGQLPAVTGFAAAQAGTVRQALTRLGEIADLTLADDGAMLTIGTWRPATLLADADLGATDRSAVVPQRHEARDADTAVPDAIWVSYGDPARDYQTGIQAATRRTPALRIEQRDLTIAASASDAKALAEAGLRRAIAARSTAQFALPWRYAGIRAGDLIVTADDAVPWRVTHRTITGAVIDLDAARVADPVGATATAADAGRAYVGLDAPPGPTILHVLDIPALPGTVPTGPQLLLAASGTNAAWRRADILTSRDGGDSYTVALTVAAPATIGTATTALPPGTATRWDRQSTVDVELASATADLQSATESAVLAGANLAVIGDEIVQFAVVRALGGQRYRLSTLLRGRRGSEDAIGRHLAGERFVLLDSRIVAIDLPAEALNAPLVFKAVGPGEDVTAVVAAQAVVPRGFSLRPLSPAKIVVTRSANGDRQIEWVRRSRAGFAWSDGTDAPVAEDSERYRLTVRRGAVVLRTIDVVTATWTYAAADFAADAAIAVPTTIDVAQVSAVVGAGLAATAALA